MRYDVVAFLRALYDPAPDVKPDDLPTAWQDVYHERAAIREDCSGLPRELAEHYALLDTLELMKQ